MAKREMPKKKEIMFDVESQEAEVAEIKPDVETPPAEIVETVAEETLKPFIGVVSGCTQLNVRKEPKVGSEVLCVIKVKDEVTIDKTLSNTKWYAVITSDCIKGFCMKDYITIK